MKRKINSQVYDVYFESKWESDRDWIYLLFNAQFQNYTYSLEKCIWHGAKEDTLHLTILDDDCLGNRAIMCKLNTIVRQYNLHSLIKAEVLVTVSEVQAHFLNGGEK